MKRSLAESMTCYNRNVGNEKTDAGRRGVRTTDRTSQLVMTSSWSRVESDHLPYIGREHSRAGWQCQ